MLTRLFNWLFESPTKRKFKQAKLSKEKRLLIENDKKRQAKNHPTY